MPDAKICIFLIGILESNRFATICLLHFPSIIVIDIMLQKFKDVIFVLVASPLQHAFNLHQTVPDHGHGSVALTGALSNNVISLMRARFIDFPKCSCMIWKSLLILPLLLELVAFFIEKLVLYKVTNFQGIIQYLTTW